MVRKPAADLITEYAYLIERVHEGSPMWMRHDATWTSDATEARRFVSQEEAGRVIAATRSEARVVEHGFSARPVMPDRPAVPAPSADSVYEGTTPEEAAVGAAPTIAGVDSLRSASGVCDPMGEYPECGRGTCADCRGDAS